MSGNSLDPAAAVDNLILTDDWHTKTLTTDTEGVIEYLNNVVRRGFRAVYTNALDEAILYLRNGDLDAANELLACLDCQVTTA